MFVLYAEKNQLTVREKEPVTSGSVNAYAVRFEFSPDWDGLEKVVMFQAGGVDKAVRLSGQACTIPSEPLAVPGHFLMAGVCGKRGNSMVLPTVWANLGLVWEGAGDTPGPEPPSEGWQEALEGKGDALGYTEAGELGLYSGDKLLSSVPVAGGGGIAYRFGHGLKQNGLDVSVDAVSDFSGDNTLPMTAAGVQASVGNIEALLATI